MNKEELIGKLQMVYVGDTNALNELIGYYDGLKQGIDELKQENQNLKEQLETSEKARKEAIEYVKKRKFDRAEILVDMECEYYYDDDFKDSLLYILEKE